MSKRNYNYSKQENRVLVFSLVGIFCLSLVLFFPTLVEGEMSSTHYTIFADSIDSGGLLSTGGGVVGEDTVGEAMVGVSTGGQYTVRGGYQYLERGYLSVTVSETGLSLGQLNKNAIFSAQTVITVSTDSSAGYFLSFGTVTGNSINSVSDGAVTVGAEEYGVSVSGGASLVTGDVGVTSGLGLARVLSPIDFSTTTLMFKASISDSTTPGTYSQSVPLIVASNLGI